MRECYKKTWWFIQYLCVEYTRPSFETQCCFLRKRERGKVGEKTGTQCFFGVRQREKEEEREKGEWRKKRKIKVGKAKVWSCLL